MKTRYSIIVLMGLLIGIAGCRNTCNWSPCCGSGSAAPKPVFVAPPPPAPLIQPGGNGPPPGSFPVLPQGSPPPQQPPIITPTKPQVQSRFEPQWQPAEARAPAPNGPPRVNLYAPEPLDRDQSAPTNEPPVQKPNVRATFPSIPQFAHAMEKAYAGLRPGADGFDWLKDNGVKTVVHVRLFGEDDSADRKHAESRGLRYVAFEVSPVTVSKEKADEFIQLIRDGAKQGIFVYDQDGSLAGSLWYLYLRFGEFHPDDASQLRARSLGLQPDREGQHRDMWLAVQKLLNENSR